MNFIKVPPVGDPVPLKGIFSEEKQNTLFRIQGFQTIYLESGTSALALALLILRQKSPGREKVLVPGYACPDIISAIHYCGLIPVLIDFEKDRPFLDLQQLEVQASSEILAIIAVNFLGIQENIDEIKDLVKDQGIYVVEDSAQRAPWWGDDNIKGDVCVVSFGRGKPESVLSGGAVFIGSGIDVPHEVLSRIEKYSNSRLYKYKYILKIMLYNRILSRYVYGLISSIPFLHVGETKYKKLEAIREMPPVAKSVLNYRLGNQMTGRDIAVYISSHLSNETRKSVRDLPLVSGLNNLHYLLRYPILLPTSDLRDAFISKCSKHGVTTMYPTVLPDIDGLAWLDVGNGLQNAREFAGRLVTLPCHVGVTRKDIDLIMSSLDKVLAG